MHPLQQHIIVDKKHYLVVVSPHLTYHFISKFVARSPENLLDPYGVYFAEHNSLYISAKNTSSNSNKSYLSSQVPQQTKSKLKCIKQNQNITSLGFITGQSLLFLVICHQLGYVNSLFYFLYLYSLPIQIFRIRREFCV